MSAAALNALQDALVEIYWFKNDLKRFAQQCVENRALIASVDWSGPKRQAVDELLAALTTDQDRHLGDLRRLVAEVVKMDAFPHLARLDDGAEKVRRAADAVAALRALVATHDRVATNADAARVRRARESEVLARTSSFREKVNELKQQYAMLVMEPAQKRGYALERLLHDLFRLFDLDPRASFRNAGEQIDGAFTLDGTDYLLEAKWQDAAVDGSDLGAFSSKVQRKLDNTLGLFLAINGFSGDAVALYTQNRPVMLLMTGRDLAAVLEQRIDFPSLLQRKRRRAAETGSILFEPFAS